MSAPETNINTQKRRHRGPLIGMAVGLIFVVVLIIYWPFGEAAPGTDPQANSAVIEGVDAPTADTQAEAGDTAVTPADPAADSVTAPGVPVTPRGAVTAP